MKLRPAILLLLTMVLGWASLSAAYGAEREVSFKTDDGLTIYAYLDVPADAKGPVPAVILLPSRVHDHSAFGIYKFPGKYQYPGLSAVITGRGVATLALDMRGHGKSVRSSGPAFGDDVQSKSYLDVKGAIEYLASQKGIDGSRLGIVAEGSSAEPAVMGWNGDTRVKAMMFISGRLSEAAKTELATNPSVPLLLMVSSEDRKSFGDMTDVYFASSNKQTNIEVYRGLGVGTGMFSVWRYKFPKEKLMHQTIGEWISGQLLSAGTVTEVSFKTSDGWTIYGNLRIPEGTAGKVPGVVLLHSGLSDRYVYHNLEIALAKGGLAVLNIDWRGNGKSVGKGRYFELTKPERDKAYLDAAAAVEFLASQPGVDSNEIGVLGTVLGAKYAMAAAAEDPRVKTAVVLTGYIPTDAEKTYFTTHNVPVFYVSSSGHTAVTKALTDFYNSTRDKGSRLLVYNGGAIGYQLLELHDELTPEIVSWMKDKLTVETAGK